MDMADKLEARFSTLEDGVTRAKETLQVHGHDFQRRLLLKNVRVCSLKTDHVRREITPSSKAFSILLGIFVLT